MDIRWNSGITQGLAGQEVTRTAINSIETGVSQATPAGIAAAKDAFEKTTILGTIPGQVPYGGIAPVAHQLSPADYLQEFKNPEMVTESMRHINSLEEGLGESKMYDGITKKLTRERLDSLANHPEPLNFFNPEQLARLSHRLSIIRNMIDAHKDSQKNAVMNLKP